MALLVDTSSQKPYCYDVNTLHIPRCCFNLWDITISMIFEKSVSRETSLKLEICALSPFLYIDFMLEYFSRSEYIPCVSDILRM